MLSQRALDNARRHLYVRQRGACGAHMLSAFQWSNYEFPKFTCRFC